MANSKGILCGALLGGLAVGAYVAFCKSKTAGKLRNKISENCEDLSDKIEDFFDSLKDNVKNDFHEHVENLSERTKGAMQYMKDEIGTCADLDNKEFRTGIVVGGLLGALLTVGTTIAYKVSCAEKEEVSLLNNIGNQACKWSHIIQEALEDAEMPPKRQMRENHAHPMNDVLEFASMGLRLWNNMKSRR